MVNSSVEQPNTTRVAPSESATAARASSSPSPHSLNSPLNNHDGKNTITISSSSHPSLIPTNTATSSTATTAQPATKSATLLSNRGSASATHTTTSSSAKGQFNTQHVGNSHNIPDSADKRSSSNAMPALIATSNIAADAGKASASASASASPMQGAASHQPSPAPSQPNATSALTESNGDHAPLSSSNQNGKDSGDHSGSVTAPSETRISSKPAEDLQSSRQPESISRERSEEREDNSPDANDANGFQDEIIVGAGAEHVKSSPRDLSEEEDEVMADADEPAVSHYPKRKRTSVFNDLSESKIEIPTSIVDGRTPLGNSRGRGNAAKGMGGKGVIVGHWRDSTVPNDEDKHAIIGFIDVRDRLRTRIQQYSRAGQPVGPEYPVPPGTGGSWVTFDRIVFSKHLVGLDQQQVKEFVKLRSDTHEASEAERTEADAAAVKEAIRRVKENPPSESQVQPQIAYGRELPGHRELQSPDPKRRRVSSGFAAINPAPSPRVNGTGLESPRTPSQPAANASSLDPLYGTRPTRIIMGYWKNSSETDPNDRHAVYGILGQNDMFRVKLVRETRDGRFVDGNFPIGAGALWIPYEEVAFESHISELSRAEIKEYCRVRQYQIDHGETSDERSENEKKAVVEAKARCVAHKNGIHTMLPAASPALPSNGDDLVNGKASRGPELRQSRRIDAKNDTRPARHPLPDHEPRHSRNSSTDAARERTAALANREISRAEAAQTRADRHALNRERAAAAAAEEAAAAAARSAAGSTPPLTNGRSSRFHESDDMQRLNKIWANQESLRVKAGAEDAKIYDGIKYERKSNGPFMGKLVSQGTIINIDGEDYVEYRVLTKPAFF